jgi:hypothetical protein
MAAAEVARVRDFFRLLLGQSPFRLADKEAVSMAAPPGVLLAATLVPAALAAGVVATDFLRAKTVDTAALAAAVAGEETVTLAAAVAVAAELAALTPATARR